MTVIISIFLFIAVAIMIISIMSFVRSKKIIQDTLNSSHKRLSYLLNVYAILLLFFALAYIIYLINWQIGKMSSNMPLLVPSILFWGSIFVFISMHFLKLLLDALLTAKMNQIDSLTGLLNKDAVKKSVDHLLLHSSTDYSLLLLDLDNFKYVNDVYGHLEGDRIIQHVACSLRNTLCVEDIVGRFGGDEFVILLTDTNRTHTLNTANRLNAQLQVLCEDTFPELNLSTSIGVAYRKPSDTYDDLFKRADSAMYQSKSNGKNRVTESC